MVSTSIDESSILSAQNQAMHIEVNVFKVAVVKVVVVAAAAAAAAKPLGNYKKEQQNDADTHNNNCHTVVMTLQKSH